MIDDSGECLPTVLSAVSWEPFGPVSVPCLSFRRVVLCCVVPSQSEVPLAAPFLRAPSRDAQVSIRAQEVVELAVKSLDGAGVPGVEMFLPGDGASPAMLYRNSRAILLCPPQVKFS